VALPRGRAGKNIRRHQRVSARIAAAHRSLNYFRAGYVPGRNFVFWAEKLFSARERIFRRSEDFSCNRGIFLRQYHMAKKKPAKKKAKKAGKKK
jgi:hypothetical protein